VVPERCEQFRESTSLDLDGMLSKFERRLLDVHLESCAACRAFAGEIREQTAQLRAAPLEAPPVLTNVAHPRSRTLRHRTAGFAAAVAVAAIGALISLAPDGDRQSASAGHTPNSELLAVVPEAPTPNATFEIGRFHLVSAASADGPVRGYYGVPA
jgi:predicted anti-sigma-YlaC factor YlaD